MVCGRFRGLTFLSTPSARRATGKTRQCNMILANFYPRPPRGGRRTRLAMFFVVKIHFYPRPPRGGRPDGHCSAHSGCYHFYPRPPRGGRPVDRGVKIAYGLFLSTPSARRATSH